MNILFLIGHPPEKVASSWKELQKYKEFYPVPTWEIYSLIKALERNKEFEVMIKKARKNVGLPEEGISWQEYFDKYMFTHHPKGVPFSGEERKRLVEIATLAGREITKIKKALNLNYFVEKQLSRLIFGDFVYFEPPIIWFYNPYSKYEDEYHNSVTIQISRQATKNEVINFIENNWKRISRSIQGLEPKPDIYISLRDQRIIELRDEDGLQFKDIADKIIEEFGIDNSDGKVNEGSVKNAHSRAKKKILSLIKAQGNKKLQ